MTNEHSLLEEVEPPTKTPRSRVAAFIIGLGAFVTLAVTAFAWPASNSTPHDIQLALVGAPPAIEQVASALEENSPGVFDLTAASTAADATAQVANGSIDGAIMLSTDAPPDAIIASQASAPDAQLITSVANGLATQQAIAAGQTLAPTATVNDLAPLPSGDPRGIVITAALFPLFIAGMASGGLALFMVRGTRRRLVVAIGAPIIAGLGMTLVMQTWLDALGGPFLAQWGAISLGATAISLAILGLSAVLGRIGIGVTGFVMLMLGNPFSGAATGTDFLPGGWGAIGQALPPGAAATSMRDIAAYGSPGTSIWILSAWVLVGLGLVIFGEAKAHRLNS